MRGAIAAGHPLTAEVGARVLANGGNCVDACIAAAFAAFVTEGPLTGPAGRRLLPRPRRRRADADRLLLRRAHRAARGDRRADGRFRLVDSELPRRRGLVAVPGLLAGLAEAHARFGRLEWGELMAPAIELARTGVDVSPAQAFLHEILVAVLQRDEGAAASTATPSTSTRKSSSATLERVQRRSRRGRARARSPSSPTISMRTGRSSASRCARRSAAARCVTTPPPSRGGAIVASVLAGFSGASSLNARAHALRAAYAGYSFGGIAGTTHVSVVDADGNAAGLSSTLGAGVGHPSRPEPSSTTCSASST